MNEKKQWAAWSDLLYSFKEDPKALNRYIALYPENERPLVALALSVAKWKDFDRLMNVQHDTNTCACCQFSKRVCKNCFMESCGVGSLYEEYCISFFESRKETKKVVKKIVDFLYVKYARMFYSIDKQVLL